MKKVLLKFWSFITSNYLQSILGFIAFLSWYEAYDLGNTTKRFSEVGRSLSSFGGGGEPSQEVAVAGTSGYDGGALAMGLITCACLISIVWLEVNKSKLHK